MDDSGLIPLDGRPTIKGFDGRLSIDTLTMMRQKNRDQPGLNRRQYETFRCSSALPISIDVLSEASASSYTNYPNITTGSSKVSVPRALEADNNKVVGGVVMVVELIKSSSQRTIQALIR